MAKISPRNTDQYAGGNEAPEVHRGIEAIGKNAGKRQGAQRAEGGEHPIGQQETRTENRKGPHDADIAEGHQRQVADRDRQREQARDEPGTAAEPGVPDQHADEGHEDDIAGTGLPVAGHKTIDGQRQDAGHRAQAEQADDGQPEVRTQPLSPMARPDSQMRQNKSLPAALAHATAPNRGKAGRTLDAGDRSVDA
ncbi:MAG: hypothetical protein U5L08_13495 [Xanthomonadales bacterium]|nr:hypothetical protein [Xanthomonadales bacterium]